ncbi:uncharacterized protein NEMAJ01_1261 [Nematocida major]|uniref:uncharacterized protein n=1 Tax=Nematocida major TaxID=1912982 RepID=UPI002008A3AF|nr:uncharacterized protein NEMAJ01_1261 [Nematocida major]KAH9386365.1 hypothetical protein NEMAJ01_1261 [Nematocida major]
MKIAEEEAENISLSILESSSRSLLDVSWLSSVQQPEAELTEPVYLPAWLGMEAPSASDSAIQIRVDGAYYEFLIEKYPETEEAVARIEQRIAQNKKPSSGRGEKKEAGGGGPASSLDESVCEMLCENVFFLWEREAAERNISRQNIYVVKEAIRNARMVTQPERSMHIAECLMTVSMQRGVSFVHVGAKSLAAALESLEGVIRKSRQESGPALRLRKTKNPESLLETVLRSAGVSADEIACVQKKYKSLADIASISASADIEGVKPCTLKKICSLFL